MASVSEHVVEARILPVILGNLGSFQDAQSLETWELPADTKDLGPLQEAAKALREGDTPVGFPTETVYGLGADATRSDAVKGIYKAKGRPSDNPLIIHVCDLSMLRGLLARDNDRDEAGEVADPVPTIYKPLIEQFWPGPLTILLPNPTPSRLAPEVTAGLPTFGARMPDSPLALSLIQLSGVPLAAPSANASTKPSPTTAAHVWHDLHGKIDMVLDGGPCLVGVESTVVDGLCDPPVVLRPGGVSIDQIRKCEGWAGVVRGYKDASEIGTSAPRAPGMKYKHYSPKAQVVLYERSKGGGDFRTGIPQELHRIMDTVEEEMTSDDTCKQRVPGLARIGIVSTKHWKNWAGFDGALKPAVGSAESTSTRTIVKVYPEIPAAEIYEGPSEGPFEPGGPLVRIVGYVFEKALGGDKRDIAHGLFSALRELDQLDVDVIFVEGIEDEGDIAAAVMNRLRKAASRIEP
ncbi:uncharacterized protein L3040_009316 [Drepanopeziza brunnea f. sp. 'multigermtubi']|uniref:Threonylcarbamoyl-AMP synthase n=1 Tax=Marssonina brunnea f. sp. multigermtubi (strain MB_m1) TaxID=1072389 RepID=K1Y280_MARBU|nr:translation initiation protein Sua5 [Drepanopeziza brunnea f. sp. 'multigermtubi' MB_m1]EKD19244.1 translation initiation protein Sua5 [Drepanopeziza brunnea f. sp. 'multigermtubi' MB_m1]KAJ5032722.1 hypothetical protein L3040_009316 [Drepanopeziza brunnea f. sp. 'multigermtubi']